MREGNKKRQLTKSIQLPSKIVLCQANFLSTLIIHKLRRVWHYGAAACDIVDSEISLLRKYFRLIYFFI